MSAASIPYAGSKISLISKSDIRYVGTLHSINQQDSTVSLEQVRSYGTEGRKKNKSEEISGTDQIYEYIVFRGSDIKDLQVCEAPQRPPQPPQVQVPKDPAILGTTAPAASSIPPGFSMMQGLVDGNMLPPNLQVPLNGINPYLLQLYQQQLWQQQLQQQQQQPAASLLKTNDPASNDQNNNIISAMEKLNLAADPNAKPKDESQQAKTTTERTDGSNQQNDKNNNRSQNNTNNYNNRNYNSNNRFQRGNRQNNYRRGSNQRGRRNWNNTKQITIPDSDFDFETSNAKFKELSNKEADKNEKKEQTEDGNVQDGETQEESGTEEKPQENFYNKSSSFFDNISCESKDRAEEQGKKFDRRAKQYEERKLNMETFGQATVNRGGHRGYRRNNYHSYRGRNYNRNGGYHRNNYRNNYNNNYNNNNRQKNQDQQATQNNNNSTQQQQKQETTQ